MFTFSGLFKLFRDKKSFFPKRFNVFLFGLISSCITGNYKGEILMFPEKLSNFPLRAAISSKA
ncbi:hypothetical protein, partial [Rahnella aceris]